MPYQINCTPLSAIVRHANASISVPISSTIIISGVWFSTASIIILCCSIGFGTCIRRALPIAGCGISPSPPISLDVSIITTLFCRSSDNTLAISQITVVFPTPGFPRNNIESPLSLFNTSEIISTCPVTALPTRQVKPIIFRFDSVCTKSYATSQLRLLGCRLQTLQPLVPRGLILPA